jgi:hypothetical protein
MNKTIVKITVLLLSCFTIFLTSTVAYAVEASSYESYGYNAWGDAVAMPHGYLPEETLYGKDLGCSHLLEPSDLYVNSTGEFFLADSGNNRILILDSNLYLKKEISTLYNRNGQEESLNYPTGVFCDDNGYIYIADKNNGRVIKIDRDGQILDNYGAPQDEDIGKLIEYKPSKVLVDKAGFIYVLVDGLYRGAITYDSEGNFIGFFGSNTVEFQFSLMLKRIQQIFMTKKQRETWYRNIPIEFINFDIDPKGFIYTCSSSMSSVYSRNELKKINFAGYNIFHGSKSNTPTAWNDGNFGDIEVAYEKGVKVDTSFVDIVVDEENFVTAVDATRGRVFQYDSTANLVFIFGGIGDQLGTFQIPSAIETYKGKIYVLDFFKNSITVFKPTELGNLVRSALTAYNRGMYIESMDPWTKVLKSNTNYELAYVGLGKANYQLGNYKEAIKYFELGNDVRGRSMAFAGYRAQLIANNFSYIVLILAVLIACLVVVARLRKKSRERKSLYNV